MDTDNFIPHFKTEDLYEDIANDVEKWFEIHNIDENKTGKRPLSIDMNKKQA